MGRPRKTPDSTASPRQAATVPKATPAAPRSSASSTQAKTTPTASRPKSAQAAGSSGTSRAQTDKPTSSTAARRAGQSSSQSRATAAHGSDQGDTKISYRVTAKNPTVTSGGKPCSTTAKAPAGADPCLGGSQSSHTRANTTGQCKASKFSSLLTTEDVVKVERETRGQRDNPKWYEWRENRITASVAPRIANSKFVNGKSSEVPQSYLKAVVSSGSKVQTPAMSWGTRNEKRAVQAYEELQSRRTGRPVKVEDCGLFIHPGKEWLAASPDGIVREADTRKLLEVKCPYKHRDKTVKEACKDKAFCLNVDGESYSLKRDHPYYTQVQCELATTGLDRADFVVHTNKDTVITSVDFDAGYWERTEPKLEKFYTEAVIPHLEKRSYSVWAKEE
ncbi:alk-exo [Chelydra serpentina]|uniref:Alk-exo n=1 Tax=Chelydra serpentina TaxID=8475 RepID=A0A8T1S701_CHESE|nr:alk-exo [Chelydra serpentina]